MSRFRRHARQAPVALDPTIVAIADAPARRPVRICGQVVRMRTRPAHGVPVLAVSISDETAMAVLVWMGRRQIPGIALGRRLVVEGVAVQADGHLEFINPLYELQP